MTDIIEALLAQESDGAIVGQFTIGAGIQVPGTLTRYRDQQGIYELTSITQHPQTKALLPIKSIISGAAVIMITPMPKDQVESVQQRAAGSGLVIPGRRH